MVKAVLLNGAGKYYTIFCPVATLVSNLVTAAMESNSNTDNIIRLWVFVFFFLNYDLVATEFPILTPWQQDPSSLLCTLAPKCQGVK